MVERAMIEFDGSHSLRAALDAAINGEVK
jgi:hypothetical protein